MAGLTNGHPGFLYKETAIVIMSPLNLSGTQNLFSVTPVLFTYTALCTLTFFLLT